MRTRHAYIIQDVVKRAKKNRTKELNFGAITYTLKLSFYT